MSLAIILVFPTGVAKVLGVFVGVAMIAEICVDFWKFADVSFLSFFVTVSKFLITDCADIGTRVWTKIKGD